jgi:hypothetical protein
MSLYDAAVYACVAVLAAALFYVPRKVSGRQRLRLGALLFAVGLAGILLALSLSHLPVFQSVIFAYTWMGLFAAAIVIAILFLDTATI